MRRPTSRNLVAFATLATMVLVGCSTGNGVSGGGGASAGQALTPVPTIETAAPTTVAPTAAPTEAPTTVAPVTTAAPTTAAPTTTVAPTTLPPETTTTLPPETVPAVPPGFELAPPITQVVTAVGKADGDATRALQQRLLELGFWLNGVDGDFGTTTRQAVMAFQKYNLLPVTGSVDQATADAINLMPYRARAVSTEGDLIEINKTAQLLFIVRAGRTDWVLNTSTGNGQQYTEEDQNSPGEMVTGVSLTPEGTFKVNRERPEGWWEGSN